MGGGMAVVRQEAPVSDAALASALKERLQQHRKEVNLVRESLGFVKVRALLFFCCFIFLLPFFGALR